MAKILIADDDAHISRVMSIWLTRNGHQATCVSNGKKALECFESQPLDLVITDMNMPELDGLGLVQAIRERPRGGLPIIVLSARCDQKELVGTLSSYGVPVYPKPFLPSYLMSEIERMLESEPRAPQETGP